MLTSILFKVQWMYSTRSSEINTIIKDIFHHPIVQNTVTPIAELFHLYNKV